VNQPPDHQPTATNYPSTNPSRHRVIKLEYSLEIEGKVVNHTHKGDPITILTGFAKQLPPGLEALLQGRKAGESFTASLPPSEGYGEYDLKKNQNVPRSSFPTKTVLEPGSSFYAQDTAGQPITARVIEIHGENVSVDFNHQHAGKTLEYRVTIHAVREAEPGEIEHGHVHGEGGIKHEHPAHEHEHSHEDNH
jgi:FKBP-type peptidyl-prolyl cis-trans isomerase SlyD